ncbi:MAG: M10 family metallopeptidase C-terminal domain-containing protein, partial [Paracoccaceae bacterium]
MARLSVRAVFGTGEGPLVTNITGLRVGNGVVHAATDAPGGLTAWRLAEAATPARLDLQSFPSGVAPHAGGLWRMEAGSDAVLVLGGGAGAGLIGYAVDDAGRLGAAREFGPLPGRAAVTGMAEFAGDTVYVARAGGGGVETYRIGGSDGLAARAGAVDTDDINADAPVALSVLDGPRGAYLFVASGTERGLSAWRIDPASGAPSHHGSAGADTGVGVMEPTALAAFSAYGADYALLGSAANGSGMAGALSLFRVDAAGGLSPVDHLLDSSDTRFGRVQDVAVVGADDRHYVIAGGGDDGLSLFTLLPDGKLLHLHSLPDSFASGLSNVSALAAARMGDEIQVIAAAQAEPGLTVLEVSIADQGRVLRAGDGGQALRGGAGDDLIAGGNDDDRLDGGAGDDILVDGAGTDRLTGGPGADIFVLSADGATDRILDFQPGLDRIDLTGFPGLYDPAQLTFNETGGGARIAWRGEVTEISRAGGGGLTIGEVFGGSFRAPHRPPIVVPTAPRPEDDDDDDGGTGGGRDIGGGDRGGGG